MPTLEYTEYINGRTVPTYKKDNGDKMNKIIDKDLVIDSLKSKIKHEEGKIAESNTQIELSEELIEKCKKQIVKLTQEE